MELYFIGIFLYIPAYIHRLVVVNKMEMCFIEYEKKL